MDRREKALEARKKSGDNRTKESAPVVSSRKSKWDQQGPGVSKHPCHNHVSPTAI